MGSREFRRRALRSGRPLDIERVHFSVRSLFNMRLAAKLPCRSALGAALSFLVMASGIVQAQTPIPTQAGTAVSTAAAGGNVDALNQTELLKAYLQTQQQLQAAQLAIVNNRVEAEAAARVQAAAVAEKIDAMKAALEVERERQRFERQQAEAERERERIEAERSHRTVLWIAGIFGGVGLLAILVTPLLQWRAINRMAEIGAQRPQLAAPDHGGLLPAGMSAPSDQTVTSSNQRLLSMIDRMEQRIFELEHTSSSPQPAASQVAASAAVAPVSPVRSVEITSGPPSAKSVRANPDQGDTVAVLLGRGRLLLEANKPRDAVACYDELLRIDANNAEALVRKGSALERLRRDEEALQCYNLAIRADRRKTLAYLYKGAVCNRLARYAESVESYELALKSEEAGA